MEGKCLKIKAELEGIKGIPVRITPIFWKSKDAHSGDHQYTGPLHSACVLNYVYSSGKIDTVVGMC